MNQQHILLIDDDQELAELLTSYLSKEGFTIECCFEGISGLAKCYEQHFNLILLDVMMPGLDGFEILKALGGHHQTPILMLTAKGDDDSRVAGLQLGADDYLAKPFNPKELLARIHAILRRISISQKNKNQQSTLVDVNQVTINHANHQVLCHGKQIILTATEYQILSSLMSHAGQIVSKELLSQQVLGRKLSPFDRSIDMHVSNIRRKLLSYSSNDKIKTVRGAGYIFLIGVEHENAIK